MAFFRGMATDVGVMWTLVISDLIVGRTQFFHLEDCQLLLIQAGRQSNRPNPSETAIQQVEGRQFKSLVHFVNFGIVFYNLRHGWIPQYHNIHSCFAVMIAYCQLPSSMAAGNKANVEVTMQKKSKNIIRLLMTCNQLPFTFPHASNWLQLRLLVLCNQLRNRLLL